jgi:hypothetical protein
MATYRIYWKGYYREHSEFAHIDVEAPSKRASLRQFFREIRSELRENDEDDSEIPDLRKLRIDGEYSWWVGDWLHDYRGLEEIDAVTCPVCEGRGEVTSTVASSLVG